MAVHHYRRFHHQVVVGNSSAHFGMSVVGDNTSAAAVDVVVAV